MNNDDLNAKIRQAAGRRTPQELAAEAIDAAAQAGDARALRERLAEQAGLPPAMGSRLQGQDAGELAEDAKRFAEDLGVGGETSEPQSMSDLIRQAAGRAPAASPADVNEPPPVPDFDSGVRGVAEPPPEPSMSAQIRAERQERLERRVELANDFDS